jgi:hypothetical protein
MRPSVRPLAVSVFSDKFGTCCLNTSGVSLRGPRRRPAPRPGPHPHATRIVANNTTARHTSTPVLIATCVSLLLHRHFAAPFFLRCRCLGAPLQRFCSFHDTTHAASCIPSHTRISLSVCCCVTDNATRWLRKAVSRSPSAVAFPASLFHRLSSFKDPSQQCKCNNCYTEPDLLDVRPLTEGRRSSRPVGPRDNGAAQAVLFSKASFPLVTWRTVSSECITSLPVDISTLRWAQYWT